MEMLLMGVCVSMFGLAVAALAFGAATRTEETTVLPQIQPVKTDVPARFFADYAVKPAAAPPRVPIEALLLQIENHVRLEQAAAESFIEYPTSALLHSKTISTFLN
ncbi:MAG: hypothetical protein ABSC23_11040 [Bryobacteraceae bacterium]|jgi:hypothetical protein